MLSVQTSTIEPKLLQNDASKTKSQEISVAPESAKVVEREGNCYW